jgi:Ca2+/H+ antiporter, TMEM165/GDT1 family
VEDLLPALGLVFLAELGDKSMMLAVALAARYRPLPVLGGIAVAAFVMLGIATLVGVVAGAALPERGLAVGGGLLFVGFGIWTLREDEDDDDGIELRSGSVLLGVTLAFFVAEFGDKTMLATIALSSTSAPVPTWIGAALGMISASGLAIAATAVLGSRLPPRIVRLLAAGAFLVFGALLLAEGVRG